MKSILIVFLLISNFIFSQNPNYFKKGREYHYNTIYIDSHGDTIIQDKMILKPLEHPWIFQPRVQTAIRYIYLTDTAGYKNYIDPEAFYHEKDVKYLKKKGKVRIDKQETTGATQKYGFFYMHPPRINQFRMLFYAAHPQVYFNVLNDSVNVFTKTLYMGGFGDFKQEYTVAPINDTLISDSKIKVWSVFAKSKGDIKKHFEKEKMYNSTLDAIFTYEYGFIKMYYTFENGIKMQFDFEKMVVL